MRLTLELTRPISSSFFFNTSTEGVIAPPRNLLTEKNKASLWTGDASNKVGFISNDVYGAVKILFFLEIVEIETEIYLPASVKSQNARAPC